LPEKEEGDIANGSVSAVRFVLTVMWLVKLVGDRHRKGLKKKGKPFGGFKVGGVLLESHIVSSTGLARVVSQLHPRERGWCRRSFPKLASGSQ